MLTKLLLHHFLVYKTAICLLYLPTMKDKGNGGGSPFDCMERGWGGWDPRGEVALRAQTKEKRLSVWYLKAF